MSLHARKTDGVPKETARVGGAAFPKGSLAMRVRDELGELFSDADFPSRGRPAPPDRTKALAEIAALWRLDVGLREKTSRVGSAPTRCCA
ncbi:MULTISPECIES: hypothetical protein [unclassified Streptomyces]|uniref:hypothetical protein n=1 Tax=unclassified Streptomyces TaxID=2593676 RepID=UPI00068DF313|nr:MULTISPECIES: hypothetical protein [unclassified Streptomyces]